LDRDGRARRDVGQRRGEDVRPLLLDEARALAFLLGLLVGGFRGSALPDDTVDDPVPDPHAQGIRGGVVGQGEDVQRLRPLVTRIRELLAQRCPGHHAGDPQLDVGPDDGRRPGRGVLGGTPEQRALTDAAGTWAVRPVALCRCRRHRQGGGGGEQEEARATRFGSGPPGPPPPPPPGGAVCCRTPRRPPPPPPRTAGGARRAYGRGGGVGDLPDLDVDPAVELLAFPTGFVADRAVGPDGRDLHARLGDAQLDEELFDRLGALPGQQLVVLGRALTV